MCNDFQRSPNNSLWVEYTSSNESSKAPISPDLFGKKPHSIPREMSSSSDSPKIPQHHLPNKVSSRQSSNGKIQIRHLMGKTKTTAHSTYHRAKKINCYSVGLQNDSLNNFKSGGKAFKSTRQKLKRKFRLLFNKKKPNNPHRRLSTIKNTILQLQNDTLTNEEINILSL